MYLLYFVYIELILLLNKFFNFGFQGWLRCIYCTFFVCMLNRFYFLTNFLILVFRGGQVYLLYFFRVDKFSNFAFQTYLLYFLVCTLNRSILIFLILVFKGGYLFIYYMYFFVINFPIFFFFFWFLVVIKYIYCSFLAQTLNRSILLSIKFPNFQY